MPALALLQCLCLCSAPTPAQATSSAAPACTLSKQAYSCDGLAFQKQLAAATTVSIETHSIDKYAQAQLASLITKKLGKVLVPERSPTSLVFLLIPLGGEGMTVNPGDTPLGTLRIYAPAPDNTRGDLIWAETYSGQEDLSWPTVVNALILQFRSHFHIK